MAASARKTVELFYDVVSPYSWIGFEVMSRYKSKWNMDLILKPFFLSGIMQGSGNKPPGFVPNKFKYMAKDLVRLREFYGVPLEFPADPADVMFNKGSLSAQRFLTAVDMQQPEKTEELSRQLWMRIWNKDEDITQESSFREAGKKAGLSSEVLESGIKGIKDQAVKDRLKEYTTQAMDYGAFGSPLIIAHVNNRPEMFFGSDRFPQLAVTMEEEWEGPLKELSKC